MTAESVITQTIRDVVEDRADNRRLSASVRACRSRSSDFQSPEQMVLTGIAMNTETRRMLTRALTRHWDRTNLPGTGRFDYIGDRDLVIGAGYTAAVFAASRVAAGYRPPIVVERNNADAIGGAFAVSLEDVFRLNNRTRPGPAGLPDQDKGLSSIPGAPLQPAMITSEEYMGNGLWAWLIRLTLAKYADVYPDVNVTQLRVSQGGGMEVKTDRGDILVKRVLDARGCGQQAPVAGSNIFTFAQFMKHMGGMFPLRGMKQIAIIGGGNSGLCAAESALGIAPANSSVIGLDYVNRVDLYAEAIDGRTCSDFRDGSRGRYMQLAQSLPGNVSNPTDRLLVMNERGYVSPMPGGVLVNGRTYDMAVMCTGLELPALDDVLGYSPLRQSQNDGTELAKWAKPFQSYRIGPAARIDFSQAEIDAGITAIPATKDAMFRTGPRTAALAMMLSLVIGTF